MTDVMARQVDAAGEKATKGPCSPVRPAPSALPAILPRAMGTASTHRARPWLPPGRDGDSHTHHVERTRAARA